MSPCRVPSVSKVSRICPVSRVQISWLSPPLLPAMAILWHSPRRSQLMGTSGTNWPHLDGGTRMQAQPFRDRNPARYPLVRSATEVEYIVPGIRKIGSGDIVSPAVRSKMMRAVRQRGTTSELAVRELLKELGARYRLNNKGLPGSPDFSNISRGWALFVNGCFWHGHRNCPKTKGGKDSRIPETRRDFWSDKIRSNRKRDARKCREIRKMGLRVMIVWECQIRHAGQ